MPNWLWVLVLGIATVVAWIWTVSYGPPRDPGLLEMKNLRRLIFASLLIGFILSLLDLF
ncbi:MAG: hypothetical protein UW73_C0041G0006 [Microgenomates group bacterium GW2011_GWB1_44_8]|nr:MAG: hypothetical protein UW73_C0041G0006 [Microgenomates group bacterium GW2011_GWB1_44_8]